eukprot:1159817-Pelagomonas_calceolata.AAC.10
MAASLQGIAVCHTFHHVLGRPVVVFKWHTCRFKAHKLYQTHQTGSTSPCPFHNLKETESNAEEGLKYKDPLSVKSRDRHSKTAAKLHHLCILKPANMDQQYLV